jgi:hypothetical protein
MALPADEYAVLMEFMKDVVEAARLDPAGYEEESKALIDYAKGGLHALQDFTLNPGKVLSVYDRAEAHRVNRAFIEGYDDALRAMRSKLADYQASKGVKKKGYPGQKRQVYMYPLNMRRGG